MRPRFFTVLLTGFAALLPFVLCNQADPMQGDVFVHDPSTIIRFKDQYWLFSTGRGIATRRSSDLIHWSAGLPVSPIPPAWTAGIVPGFKDYFWAPEIVRLNGKFLLYYSASRWGANTSAIGLATNTTLDPADPGHRWIDCGSVVQSGPGDRFNAIDPAIFKDEDGKLWMAFGSFWDGIKLVELDPKTGGRIAAGSPLYSLARNDTIEAPYLWRRGRYYYLFVNWGLCCRGVKSTYNIRVGRSKNVTGPYLDRDGVDMMRGGGTLLMGSEGTDIGPGHAGIFADGTWTLFSYHCYDATNRGKAALRLRPLNWDADGWPVLSPPIGR